MDQIIISCIGENDVINRIECKKHLLIMVPFFERLLDNEMKENKTGVIEIRDQLYADIENYIKHLNWKYNLNPKPQYNFVELCQLIRLADMWLDQENLNFFLSQWVQNIDSQTIIDALELSNYINLPNNIQELLSDVIERNFKGIDYEMMQKNHLKQMIELKSLPNMIKFYILVSYLIKHQDINVSQYFDSFSIANSISNNNSSILSELLGLLSNSNHLELLQLVMKEIAKSKEITKRTYDFDRIIDYRQFEIDKFGFNSTSFKYFGFDTIDPYIKCRSLYENTKRWVLQIPTLNGAVKLCSISEMHHDYNYKLNYPFHYRNDKIYQVKFTLDLQQTEHQKFLTVLDQMQQKILQTVNNNKNEFSLSQSCEYRRVSPESFLANIYYQKKDRKTGKIINFPILYPRCILKPDCANNLIDNNSGQPINLDKAHKFIFHESIISLYLFTPRNDDIIPVIILEKAYVSPKL